MFKSVITRFLPIGLSLVGIQNNSFATEDLVDVPLKIDLQALQEIAALTLQKSAPQNEKAEPLHPKDRWDFGIVGYANYLYWKAETTDLPYGIEGETNSSHFSLTNQNILTVHLPWDSGLEIGVGVQFPTVEWGVSADWTYYSTTGSRQFNTTLPGSSFPTSGPILEPLWTINSYLPEHFKAKQSLQYNVFNLHLFSRMVKISRFNANFFGGVKLAYIHQALHTSANSMTVSGVLFPNASHQASVINKCAGTGVDFGVKGSFPIYWGFGIDIDASAALLSSVYYLNYDDVFEVGSSTSNSMGYRKNSIALEVESKIQLHWERFFSDYKRVKIFTGFDLSYWPDQILVNGEFRGSSTEIDNQSILTLGHGSLSLYGYRFGLDFGF